MPASRRIDFPGPNGAELAARLDLPEGPPRGWALFAHCFTCGKDIAAARRIAAGLAEAGLGVLRFDFTGLGHSGGEFGSEGFSADVRDLTAAAEWMAGEGMAPGLLIGHSLGGAAALAAAGDIDSVRAVAVIGAPAEPEHSLRHLGGDLDAIREQGSGEVEIAGRAFRVSRAFVEDTAKARLGPRIGDMRRALLILHAPRDEVVGIDNATDIFVAAKHPKSFVSLDDADHLLSRPEDAAYAARLIAAWAERYLDLGAAEEAPEEGHVRVAEADPPGLRQTVQVGPHRFAADEPASVGGTGAGPTPYDLLAAALGACTTMTLRMYAERKEIPLARAAVEVRHEKVHAEDCAECEEREGKADRFERVLHLEGDLTDEQRKRLAEIADRCPVHRTLEAGPVIVTRTAED